MNGKAGETCGLCGREVQQLTRHHLIPRTRHRKIRKDRNRKIDRQELNRTVPLCGPCHRHVHVVLDNKELAREYNTLESLRAHPEVERFVEWVKDKPHGT